MAEIELNSQVVGRGGIRDGQQGRVTSPGIRGGMATVRWADGETSTVSLRELVHRDDAYKTVKAREKGAGVSKPKNYVKAKAKPPTVGDRVKIVAGPHAGKVGVVDDVRGGVWWVSSGGLLYHLRNASDMVPA